jgi:hypothetical protein
VDRRTKALFARPLAARLHRRPGGGRLRKAEELAHFNGVQRLIDNHPNEKKKLFPIPDLLHASVVLQEAIFLDDPADPRRKKVVYVGVHTLPATSAQSEYR